MTTVLRSVVELKVNTEVLRTNSDAAPVDRYRFGSSLLPAYKRVLTDGTTANTAQKHYHKAHTLTAAGSVTIDLNAAVTEDFDTINFANVKQIIFRLRTPAVSTRVVVGNASADPWAPWLSSATATEEVFDLLFRSNPVDGWTVPAAANLKINNPSAASVIVDVSIIGH